MTTAANDPGILIRLERGDVVEDVHVLAFNLLVGELRDLRGRVAALEDAVARPATVNANHRAWKCLKHERDGVLAEAIQYREALRGIAAGECLCDALSDKCDPCIARLALAQAEGDG